MQTYVNWNEIIQTWTLIIIETENTYCTNDACELHVRTVLLFNVFERIEIFCILTETKFVTISIPVTTFPSKLYLHSVATVFNKSTPLCDVKWTSKGFFLFLLRSFFACKILHVGKAIRRVVE